MKENFNGRKYHYNNSLKTTHSKFIYSVYKCTCTCICVNVFIWNILFQRKTKENKESWHSKEEENFVQQTSEYLTRKLFYNTIATPRYILVYIKFDDT